MLKCPCQRTNISVHPRLVTSLTGLQSHFYCTGLIPQPTRKAAFRRAISNAVLQFKRLTDSNSYEELKALDAVECGLVPPLLRRHHFDSVTGKHISIAKGSSRKDDQFWIRQPRTASKAASAAGSPTWTASNSVPALTQQFEQLSMKKRTSASADTGRIPEFASAPCHPIVLKHDELSMEPYTGCAFAHYELVPSAKRHLGAQFTVQAMGANFHWTLTQGTVFFCTDW